MKYTIQCCNICVNLWNILYIALLEIVSNTHSASTTRVSVRYHTYDQFAYLLANQTSLKITDKILLPEVKPWALLPHKSNNQTIYGKRNRPDLIFSVH